ncbi:hypothetical protein GCM10007049_38090 [Echinicola pacifica]|uniref:Carbohydrate kinase PfkB domain-containing protein n=1 Tax=Echinicola pacifica TaxID=346377 RepID=A0A918QE92_9BACT|nr:carbohydrate kinase family protein [Echinicola pacifica]GGZ41137.1 hypothetical protein GCM10007049_38090 [Echinicola pacifica]
MRNKDLFVVGELNVDLILNHIDGFPEMGSEKVASDMTITLGSSSAIFASNISVLGTGTAFCGKIGKDDFGKLVIDSLSDKSVDTSSIVEATASKTGLTVVMNYDQDRANVTYCGAMSEMSLEDIDWEEASKYKHFHLSNYFLQKGLQKDIVKIFATAKEYGLSTSLDLQVDPDGQWDFDYKACLPHVDVFMPNKSELLGLSHAASVEEGIAVLEPYAKAIAVKMGTEGSLLAQNGERITAPVYSHKHFVDAIGAGDSFNAGFICKYIQGSSWEESLKYGNLMGALNTTGHGGTGAFSSFSDLKTNAQKIFKEDI